jgi:myo-inositol-1(or 4)-monophosphatase
VRHLPFSTLNELENTAVALARWAGDHISAKHDDLIVQLKTPTPGAARDSNPVSNVDREVETQLRSVIHERFPRHAVLAEESDDEVDDKAPFIWVIDPLDGTTNFLNGLPLYGCSIGVLYRHVPVVGAVWCASTHECRPGVYHAVHEGQLSLNGAQITPRQTSLVRGLASEPGDVSRYGAFYETRVLAAAAVECALAAAGVLRVAYLSNPAIWDVAAGIVLARASGCRVMTKRDGVWLPFTGFSAPQARKRISKLRSWRQPVLIGDARAVNREAAVSTALI